jgi:hypothetical protein
MAGSREPLDKVVIARSDPTEALTPSMPEVVGNQSYAHLTILRLKS